MPLCNLFLFNINLVVFMGCWQVRLVGIVIGKVVGEDVLVVTYPVQMVILLCLAGLFFCLFLILMLIIMIDGSESFLWGTTTTTNNNHYFTNSMNRKTKIFLIHCLTNMSTNIICK